MTAVAARMRFEGEVPGRPDGHVVMSGAVLCVGGVVLWALAAVLALGCAPAPALVARGHVFASAFGTPGKGEGQFERADADRRR